VLDTGYSFQFIFICGRIKIGQLDVDQITFV
jgi:hypothetical protein